MSSRIFTVLAVLIVLGLYVAGFVVLAMQLRTSETPAPLGIVGGGAMIMFATVLAFALVFAKAATVKD